MKYFKNDQGVFGIFEDYPNADLILKELSNNGAKYFPVLMEYELFNSTISRTKKKISIVTGNMTLSLFTKGKRQNADFTQTEFASGTYLNFFSYSGEDLPGIDNMKRSFSVLNELCSNRKAQKRYEQKFLTKLFIEKPVGFFVSQRLEDKGARWVIFEYLDKVSKEDKVSSGYDWDEHNFRKGTTLQLSEIGIRNNADAKSYVDTIWVNNETGSRYFIVDSEDWEVLHRFRK